MKEERADYIWLNGRTVAWDEATLHVHTQCVLGGLNVYEGLKAYWSPEQDELFVFRFDAHMRRLSNSLKMIRMTLPYSLAELQQATVELLARNRFRQSVSIRIVCYFGEGVLFGYLPEEIETGAFIYATPRTDAASCADGVHCCVSSWHRISDTTAPPRIKAGANYHNVRLAHVQARVDGYEEPILLNEHGKVAEGTTRNVTLVCGGKLIVPETSSGILEGIMRASIMELARAELNLEAIERTVDRTELYTADEVFLTSSSQEVLPVLSVDRIPVGDGRPGPVSQALYPLMLEVGAGRQPRYRAWLTPVYQRSHEAGSKPL